MSLHRTHPIRVILGSPGTSTRVLQGSDERAICVQAEEIVRDRLMQGAGIGMEVSCRDPETEARIRSYLAGVGHEIQTWPTQRWRTRIR